MADIDAALNEWTKLLKPENVLVGAALVSRFGSDTSGAVRRVPAALRISDPADVAGVLAIARKHQVPVYPISTGRNWGYGTALPARDDCVILDLSAMNRILHFDAELGVVTVQPGVTQGQLHDHLVAHGDHFMVPTTGAGPEVSLLGNALERGYGLTPHADHFAAVTDLEATLPDGTCYRGPLRELGADDLARLFKWGIGPFADGLFSQGGFGVVTSVTVALARRPECIRVGLFSLTHDDQLEAAVTAVRQVLAQLPGVVSGINLMNRHRVLAMAAPYPFERRGPDGVIPPALLAEMGRQYQVLPWTGFIALFGTRRVVQAAQADIRAQLKSVASRLIFLSTGRAHAISRLAGWVPGSLGGRLRSTANTLMKSLALVSGRPNETALPLAYWRRPGGLPPSGPLDPARDGCGLTWYAPLVPMRDKKVREFVDMVRDVVPRHGMEPLLTLTSQGDRLFDSTVPLLYDRRDPRETERARACFDELLGAGRALGCLPYRLGLDQQGSIAAQSAGSARFVERLRAAIDPHGLVSPGRYDATAGG